MRLAYFARCTVCGPMERERRTWEATATRHMEENPGRCVHTWAEPEKDEKKS